MHIIFICTGNTCRSPMAKAIAENVFLKAGIDAVIASAGISPCLPGKASHHAKAVARRHGLDLSAHAARRVTEADLSAADLVLTMTVRHKEYLAAEYPSSADRIFTITEYSGLSTADILDPYGGGRSDYEACFSLLTEHIGIIAEKLSAKEEVL